MCVVSMVGDVYRDTFTDPSYPWNGPLQQPVQWPPLTNPVVTDTTFTFQREVTKEEFDALKKEVERMKRMLIAAKIYDEQNGEPNCEMDEKVELLKKIAAMMGVDLSEVFDK